MICREMGFQGGFAYFQVRYSNPKNIGIHHLILYCIMYRKHEHPIVHVLQTGGLSFQELYQFEQKKVNKIYLLEVTNQ